MSLLFRAWTTAKSFVAHNKHLPKTKRKTAKKKQGLFQERVSGFGSSLLAFLSLLGFGPRARNRTWVLFLMMP